MATGERFESVVHTVSILVLADIGGDKLPFGIDGRAITAHDILLDVVEVGLATSDAAWSWFAEQVFHALGDEERDDQGEGKTGPTFLPFPELARDHSLARKATSGAGTRNQSYHNKKDDDSWDDQSNDGEQSDGDLFLDHREGDAQVQQGERPLIRLNIIDTSADGSNEAG